MEESQAIAVAAWSRARELISSGDYDLVVLDEVTYPINWGWIDVNEVTQVLEHRPENVNVILTGRDAPEPIVAIADTVTEMRKVKHAFDRGVTARRGIDY
jgi:cob(I)alamin adenosyltransferase